MNFPEIPAGCYCYDNHGICPHLGVKTVNGVDLPWCSHLKMGSIPNGLKPADDLLLQEVWGVQGFQKETSEEFVKFGLYPDLETAMAARFTKTPKEFGLSLLWDQCKECGIADGYDEDRSPREALLVTLKVTAKLPGSKLPERTFGLSVSIQKKAATLTKVKALLRFLNQVPNHLKRLQISGAIITHPAVLPRRQEIFLDAEKINTCLPPKEQHLNLVAYAHQIIRHETSTK